MRVVLLDAMNVKVKVIIRRVSHVQMNSIGSQMDKVDVNVCQHSINRIKIV